MLKNFILFLILFFLVSCGGGWEKFEGAVTGSKQKTTDEYLIKQKDPLILPPDYKKLPLPDTKKTNTENNKIESILTDRSNEESGKKSSIEKSVERELRKKN